jgi:hypothetical protein
LETEQVGCAGLAGHFPHCNVCQHRNRTFDRCGHISRYDLCSQSEPHTCLLGSVPHTDLYMNIDRYKGVSVAPKRVEEFVKGDIPRSRLLRFRGLKIFQYCGGINFVTRNTFKAELLRFGRCQSSKGAHLQDQVDEIRRRGKL